MKYVTIVIIGVLLMLTTPASAEDHYVRMLNSDADKNYMVFEPAVLQVAVGDTVNFVSISAGHNSKSVLTPGGATPWNGKMNEQISVTLDTPGVYIYECTPHAMMAMVGVIKVGDAKVGEATKLFADQYKTRFVTNKNRLDDYLNE